MKQYDLDIVMVVAGMQMTGGMLEEEKSLFDISKNAKLVLDKCQHCQGRGHIPMRYDGQRLVVIGGEAIDATVEADCPVCLGSGKARRNYYQRAKAAGYVDYSKRLDEFWKYALDVCATHEASARAEMWRRIRRNI